MDSNTKQHDSKVVAFTFSQDQAWHCKDCKHRWTARKRQRQVRCPGCNGYRIEPSA